jgi:hypothetical protein
MNSAPTASSLRSAPDYYARALALWPRLVPPRPDRARRDPRRVATLVSRRTNLSHREILALLRAPDDEADTPRLDH